jgi:hypothetical protein
VFYKIDRGSSQVFNDSCQGFKTLKKNQFKNFLNHGPESESLGHIFFKFLVYKKETEIKNSIFIYFKFYFILEKILYLKKIGFLVFFSVFEKSINHSVFNYYFANAFFK